MLGVVMALTTRRRHCSITANAEANLIKVEGELRTRLGDDADICEAVDAAVARLRASSAEAKRQLTDEDHRQNYAKLVVLTSLPPPRAVHARGDCVAGDNGWKYFFWICGH